MSFDNDCDAQTKKARESLPDILESIRRGKTHASYLDAQINRIERAYGRDAPTKGTDDPTPEPPLICVVEDEAKELADYLLTLQESLRKELDLLFGDRA